MESIELGIAGLAIVTLGQVINGLLATLKRRGEDSERARFWREWEKVETRLTAWDRRIRAIEKAVDENTLLHRDPNSHISTLESNKGIARIEKALVKIEGRLQ